MLKREGLDWDNNVQAICFSRSSFPVYRTDVENIWEFYTLLLLMENGKLIFLLILLRWIANPPPAHTRQKKKKGKLFEGILSTNVDLWIQSSPVFNKANINVFPLSFADSAYLDLLILWSGMHACLQVTSYQWKHLRESASDRYNIALQLLVFVSYRKFYINKISWLNSNSRRFGTCFIILWEIFWKSLGMCMVWHWLSWLDLKDSDCFDKLKNTRWMTILWGLLYQNCA